MPQRAGRRAGSVAGRRLPSAVSAFGCFEHNASPIRSMPGYTRSKQAGYLQRGRHRGACAALRSVSMLISIRININIGIVIFNHISINTTFNINLSISIRIRINSN